MGIRCVGILSLGGLVLCIAVIASLSSDIIKPRGPRMCEHLCKHGVGCSSFLYTTSDLNCQLTGLDPTKASSHKAVCFYNNKDEEYAEKNTVRQTNANQQSTGGMNPLCECAQTDGRSQRTKARLLVINYDTSQKPKELYIHNYSVVPYRFTRALACRAVTYIASSNKLVMVTTFPLQLLFTGMNGEDKVIVQKRNFWHISVDEPNQLLFLSDAWAVFSMSTNGKRYKKVSKLKHQSTFITADPKRSLIYVACHGQAILRLTYKGEEQGYLGNKWLEKSKYTSLFLDLKSDCLYYMTSVRSSVNPSVIWKVSLSGSSTVKVRIFKTLCWTFYYLENHFYVTPWAGTGKLFVATESSKTTVIVSRSRTRVILCAIP